MIDKALEMLKNNLLNYLKRLSELTLTTDETVQLTPILKKDGTVAIDEKSLGLTLVNVEEERIVKSQTPYAIPAGKDSNGDISYMNPEIKVNLYLLICSNYNDYKTGLQYLSAVMRFFQGKNVFTPSDTPDMDPKIQKLIVELFTLNFEQQNHLWGSLGAKYLPSVFYKVRLVTIQEGLIKEQRPPVKVASFEERSI